MSQEVFSRSEHGACFKSSAHGCKADILSDSTKAESNYFQNSIDSRKNYVRPRTKSPFPPLKKVNTRVTNVVKESESFNSSLDKNIIDLCSETKLSPESSMLSSYKLLNCDESNWKEIVREKGRIESRTKDHFSHFRINSAQQSNPFLESSNKRFCFSIDKQRGAYKIGEMSAPGSANSFSLQMANPRRSRPNNQKNSINVKPFRRQETCVPIKIELNKKAYIDWKAVAVNSNDLNSKDKEMLGFSPSFHEPHKRGKRRDDSVIIINNNRAASYEPMKVKKKILQNLSKNLHETDYEKLGIRVVKKTSVPRKSVDGSILMPQIDSKLCNKVSRDYNYVNYSKFKKEGQSVLLYGNNPRNNSNYSFSSKPLNSSFLYDQKTSHERTEAPSKERDLSKIVMKGRKFSNAPNNQKLMRVKRKGKSLPKCSCEGKKIKISKESHKIPFLKESKCVESCGKKTKKVPRKESRGFRVPDSCLENQDINKQYYLTFGSHM